MAYLRRVLLALVFACVTFFSAYSQENGTAAPVADERPSHEVGSIFQLSLNKQIKRVGMHLQFHIFTLGARVERFAPYATVDYTVWQKHLKLVGTYYYMYHQPTTGNFYHRHRYQLGFVASHQFAPIGINWTSKFESTYTDGNPNNKWRNTLSFSYNIGNGCRWKPYVSAEVFLLLNGKNEGRVDRIWYEAGTSYTIDSKNSIDLKVREEQFITKPKGLAMTNTYIGFAYKFQL